MLQGKVVPDTFVHLPLRMMNRHGLIAGATGTGKTKSLQLLAEQLSYAGVSCFLLDIKGDLSGISMMGTSNQKIEDRHCSINIPWEAKNNYVELLTISSQNGCRLRATVSEFGPKYLDLMIHRKV